MKILIIDDSKTARMFSKKCVQMSLRSEKLEFIEAENGKEALNKLKENKVDLILSDVNMPIMTGFTFMRNVKIDPELSKIPVIFITSLANKARVENLMELGATGVVSKPVKPNELKKKIDDLHLFGDVQDKEEESSGDGWGG